MTLDMLRGTVSHLVMRIDDDWSRQAMRKLNNGTKHHQSLEAIARASIPTLWYHQRLNESTRLGVKRCDEMSCKGFERGSRQYKRKLQILPHAGWRWLKTIGTLVFA